MKFGEKFKKKAFLAVVHVQKGLYCQMVQNVDIARSEGADGVFIISHDGLFTDNNLLEYYDGLKMIVRNRWKVDFWIGVNCLGLGRFPSAVFSELSSDTDGLWLDAVDRGLYDHPEKNLEELRGARKRSKWDGVLFGGVAFKYQAPVPLGELPGAARRAMKYVDVVTTSGDATGEAPGLQKIRIMKEALGDFPLAIASGITPENVYPYLSYADAFLVSTGISKSFTELDPVRVRQMRQAIDEA